MKIDRVLINARCTLPGVVAPITVTSMGQKAVFNHSSVCK